MSITFQKRQKELKHQEKQRAKAERREQRKAANRAEEAQRQLKKRPLLSRFDGQSQPNCLGDGD